MAGPTDSVRLLAMVARRVVRALAMLGGMHAHGGVQAYLEMQQEEDRRLLGERPGTFRPSLHAPLHPPITLLSPPPGHPERLIPEVPLTPLELTLRSELAHLDRLMPGENRR
ncbi:hypothetical protein HUT16_23625 [Kitasatospora sp. NA04385]|uniref:DUF6059 family protein n=1 Tax=Kitasatospora sp. NA04385 TaxID=2742135 RepID=UPI00159111FA|nr:DUF6059 family protein [Kitasatospora sp. NA04385]QKW21650.1 hypothetical protein HUT16_23625 [Kitasatospora sp. NA04385]